MNKKQIVKDYQLQANPKGGFFKETYRSDLKVLTSYDAEHRASSSAVLTLLGLNDVFELHRLKTEELLHFHSGLPMTVAILDATKPDHYYTLKVGNNFARGEAYQVVVPGGCWFGQFISDEDKQDSNLDYSFAGATVSPGWELRDMDVGERQALLNEFPKAASIINRLISES
jgi:predicted cupin superfamily sugar epimerase